jgi:predicted nucleic acid-binding protein
MSSESEDELVDTNVILRFLMGDHPVHSPRATALFAAANRGERRLWCTLLAIAEAVHILVTSQAGARMPKSVAVARLIELVETPGLRVEQHDLVVGALQLYGAHNVDFIDAYHAALLLSRGQSRILSFDHDFDKISGMEREEP